MSQWFSLSEKDFCRLCLGLAKGCCVEQGTGGSWGHLPRDKISHTEQETLVKTKGTVIRADPAEVLCVLTFAMLASEERARGRHVMG